jgi:hypothetical protein
MKVTMLHRAVVPTLLLLALAPAAALAHTPPPVYVTAEINDEEMVVACVIGEQLFKNWLGFEAEGWPDLNEEDRAAKIEIVNAFFAEWSTITVDGIVVIGVFRDIEPIEYMDHGQPWRFSQVRMAYGLKGPPKSVAIAWRRFKNSVGWWLEYIQGEILAENAPGAYFEFSAKEPEYTWHAPAAPLKRRILTDPTYKPPEPLTLPLPSLGILAALLLALPVFRWRHVSRKVAWGAVAGCAVLSVSLAGVAQVEVLPPWAAKFRMPEVAEAKGIFESLHRNIYRAFDYTSENDVYDTLARSVTGDLLDRIYREIHESLIMRDQGGAISKITGTKILDIEVTMPGTGEDPYFDVVCTWQVRGKVGHWGHTHERVNEYRARYRVVSDGAKWRIARVETLDERRLDQEEARRTWVDPEGD